MNNKRIVALSIAVMVVIAVVLWFKYDSSKQAEAYKALFSGNVGITSISFEGQQRSLTIVDRSIIDDFENAFKNKPERLHNGCTTYTAMFLLKTGEELKTGLYIYEDKSGFQVADDSRLGAGDPTYVNVEFKKETNKRTQQLIAYLLAESPAGVLTNN
jgi:hypothetical protein